MFKNFKNFTVENINSNYKLPTQLSENLLKKKIFSEYKTFLWLLQKPFKVLLHAICQTNTCMVFKRMKTWGIVFQKPFIGFEYKTFLWLLQKPFKVLLHAICQTNTCMVFKRMKTWGIVFQKPFIGFLGYIQKFRNKVLRFVETHKFL